tara:strand:+ start:3327 stop:4187 length:861 start_codon:yes stop_codon:yes gene_type:complete
MQKFFYQILGFISLIRLFNIVLLCLAQYLASIYILAADRNFISIISDFNLFIIVLLTAISTSSGYIINNFYDSEKDKINRPKTFILGNLISERYQIKTYFFLCFITFLISFLISYKAVLFYSFYMFSIWLYSYKIKRLFWLSNFFSTALVVYPFFGVTLYFGAFNFEVILHAFFLFILLFVRDLVKDLQNFNGDWVQQYRTFPVIYGVLKTKFFATFFILISFVLIIELLKIPIGDMRFYFISSMVYVLIWTSFLWIASKQKEYLWLRNFLKFWIIIGVFSITLIN